jgi:hypothetical protein
VFLVYTQFENHVLNPVVMSKTVRISPLLVLIAVLVGASIGSWVGGLFGGFVAALLAIPAAGALQVIVVELWRLSGPSAPGDAADQAPGGQPVQPEVTPGDPEALGGAADQQNQQDKPQAEADQTSQPTEPVPASRPK